MKTIEYKMVVASPVEIEEQVNALLKQGWDLYGSPTVLPPGPDLDPQVDMVFQAMIRQRA